MPFGAIEDWNPPVKCCRQERGVAIAFRGDRGLEHSGDDYLVKFAASSDCLSGRSRIGTRQRLGIPPTRTLVAIAFRGDRGLELGGWSIGGLIGDRSDCLSGRSRIGTRADDQRFGGDRVAIAFRGDRGLEPPLAPRSPRSVVAIAFRGDRGLERLVLPDSWQNGL